MICLTSLPHPCSALNLAVAPSASSTTPASVSHFREQRFLVVALGGRVRTRLHMHVHFVLVQWHVLRGVQDDGVVLDDALVDTRVLLVQLHLVAA